MIGHLNAVTTQRGTYPVLGAAVTTATPTDLPAHDPHDSNLVSFPAGAAEVPAAAATKPASPLRPASSAPPPPSVLLDSNDDVAELLQMASQRFPDDPQVEKLQRRLEQIPREARDVVGLHLLEVMTGPEKEVKPGLDGLVHTLDWAHKFKSQARDAVLHGGYSALAAMAAKAVEEKSAADGPAATLLALKASPSMLRFNDHVLKDDRQCREAASLIDKFTNGHTNPGLGSKSLGGSIRYLRGDSGVRIFYRMGVEPEFLAIVNKSDEQAAIKTIQGAYD